MRGPGILFRSCLLLAAAHGGVASRDLQQIGVLPLVNGASSADAASPSDYSGDYDVNPEVCYTALDVIDTLNGTGNYSLNYFEEALLNTGVADLLLNSLDLLTVFAPTDAAFLEAADALNMDIDDLINSPVVIPVLLNHIVQGTVQSDELSNGEFLPTALDQYLNVSISNGNLELSTPAATATVVDADECNCELCTNVVDVIDAVLVPEILNITTNGSETIIIIATQTGGEQVFLVVDESALMDGTSPTAAPMKLAMAPATAADSSSTSSVGIIQAPTSSTSLRQGGTKTSSGMTYYTNSAANS